VRNERTVSAGRDYANGLFVPNATNGSFAQIWLKNSARRVSISVFCGVRLSEHRVSE